MTIIKKINT